MNNIKYIIIIDDNDLDREVLESYLSDYATKSFSDGSVALEYISLHPDNVVLVISSLRMKGFNGLNLLDALSDFEPTSEIPVVILTSSEDKGYFCKAYDLGAIDCIVKPLDQTIIRNRILNIITLSSRKQSYEHNDVLLATMHHLDAMMFTYSIHDSTLYLSKGLADYLGLDLLIKDPRNCKELVSKIGSKVFKSIDRLSICHEYSNKDICIDVTSSNEDKSRLDIELHPSLDSNNVISSIIGVVKSIL